MKILLINNHTVHMPSLAKNLAGHHVEIHTYKPGIKFNDQGKDLIILSGGGGEGLEIDDEYKPGQLWYEDEMKFIRETDVKIIGICMGFEVIARAYGAPVTQAPGLTLGREEIQIHKDARHLFPARHLNQYEAHRWRVQDVPSKFKVHASSKTGVEIFSYNDKVRNKKIIATQFHPEKGGTVTLNKLLPLLHY